MDPENVNAGQTSSVKVHLQSRMENKISDIRSVLLSLSLRSSV